MCGRSGSTIERTRTTVWNWMEKNANRTLVFVSVFCCCCRFVASVAWHTPKLSSPVGTPDFCVCVYCIPVRELHHLARKCSTSAGSGRSRCWWEVSMPTAKGCDVKMPPTGGAGGDMGSTRATDGGGGGLHSLGNAEYPPCVVGRCGHTRTTGGVYVAESGGRAAPKYGGRRDIREATMPVVWKRKATG